MYQFRTYEQLPASSAPLHSTPRIDTMESTTTATPTDRMNDGTTATTATTATSCRGTTTEAAAAAVGAALPEPHANSVDYLEVHYLAPGAEPRTHLFTWNVRQPASSAEKHAEVLLWAGRFRVPKTVTFKAGKDIWEELDLKAYEKFRSTGQRKLWCQVEVSG